MEGIDLLQTLIKERDELNDKVEAQKKNLDEKLFTFFKTISENAQLEMMPLHCTLSRPYSWSAEEKSNLFEVRLNVRYFDEGGATYSDGSPKPDFGSDFSLYIFDDHIKMNCGTCGDYTNKNKGQITRAFFVAKLWENEDTICSIAKATIDMNEYNELQQVRRQIDRIEEDIKLAKEAREREELLRKLKQAKYICKRTREYLNRRYDYEKHKYIDDGMVYRYYGHEEIKKITDKTVMTLEGYWKDNKRHPLSQVLSDLKYERLFLQTEIVNQEPIPSEGTSTD